MRLSIFAFLLLLTQSWLHAQSTLKCTVSDIQSGKPLPGVFFDLRPPPVPVPTNDSFLLVISLHLTDKWGQCYIPLSPELTQIEFNHPGYIGVVITGQELADFKALSAEEGKDTVQHAIFLHPNLSPIATAIPTVVILPDRDELGDANKRRGDQLHKQTGASLGEILNTVPGLQFDERGLGGSRRISLRGSMLRSPFGVRNVRVFYNEVPLTSPDGSTPLELIEPRQLGEVRVFKGPQGSWSGPGHGGRIDFASAAIPFEKNRLSGQAGLTAGSFGLFRTYAGLNWRGKKHSQYRIQYTRQEYKGFREQEGNQKDQLEVHFKLPIHKRHELSVDGWLFDGFWELPGGQTKADFETDPRAALPYSVTAQAAVERQRGRISLTHKWKNRGRFSLLTSAYGNLTAKENPYGTSPFFQGYKDESARGIGGRSKFSYAFPYANRKQWRFHLGAEYQVEDNLLDEFDNLNGEPGQLRFSSQTLASHWLTFGELEFRYERHRIVGRLGVDQTRYRFSDLQTSSPSEIFEVAPILLPDLTYSAINIFNWNWDLVLHAGTGYSPPTVWELRDQQGGPNLDLKAERSRTVEIKFARTRYRDAPRRFQFEVNAFLQETDDALVPRFTSTGIAYFENVGQIALRGAEWFLSQRLPISKLGLEDVRFWATATTQMATFGAFESANGENLAGLWVPGLARLRSSAHLEIKHRKNISLDLQWSQQGRMPLDETNANFQEGFSLFHLNLKADFMTKKTNPAYPGKVVEGIKLSPFVGINNLFDNRYNAFPVLNAARDRFYNVGAGRSFYGGVDFKF